MSKALRAFLLSVLVLASALTVYVEAGGPMPAPFIGDSGSGGRQGEVPAPAAGDAAANKYLKANGAWTAVSAGAGDVTASGTLTAGYVMVGNGTKVVKAATIPATMESSLTLDQPGMDVSSPVLTLSGDSSGSTIRATLQVSSTGLNILAEDAVGTLRKGLTVTADALTFGDNGLSSGGYDERTIVFDGYLSTDGRFTYYGSPLIYGASYFRMNQALTVETGLTVGANGKSGSIGIYSEQGATDYIGTQSEAALTANRSYSWPNEPGTVLINATATPERGDLLYRGTSGWLDLAHGTAGQALLSGGHGADPYWGAAGGSDTLATVTARGETATANLILPNAGTLKITNGSWQGVLGETTLTGNQTYALPNQSGTIALTSDIPGSGSLVKPGALWVGAGAFIPSTTNGPAFSTDESTTNKVMNDKMGFAPGAVQSAQAIVGLPKTWNYGQVQVEFVWTTTTATANNVVWEACGFAGTDGATADSAWGETVQVVDTNQDGKIMLTSASGNMTFANTPGIGVPLWLKIRRNGSTTADTLTETAYCEGAWVHFDESPLTTALLNTTVWNGCTFSMAGNGGAVSAGAHWEGAVYLPEAVTLTGWRCRGESGTSVLTVRRCTINDYYGAGTAILTGTTLGKTACLTALATDIATATETRLPADIYLVPFVTSATETILALDLLGHKTSL